MYIIRNTQTALCRELGQIYPVIVAYLSNRGDWTVTTTNLRGDRPGDFFVRVKDRLMATREIKGVRLQGVSVEFSGPSQRRV